MEVLQTSALPLGDGADQKGSWEPGEHRIVPDAWGAINNSPVAGHGSCADRSEMKSVMQCRGLPTFAPNLTESGVTADK